VPLLSLTFSPTYRASTRFAKGAAHLVSENQSSYIWKIPEMGAR
jgi:hypothetical protein